MKDLAPELLAIGEVWDTTENVLRYGTDQMDMHFQFDLARALLSSVEQGDPEALRTAQAEVWQAFAPGQYATFLSNHDQSRVMSQLGHDGGKARLAATLLLTSPGVPFIYYGEEIGMASGAESKAERRSPMQWTGEARGDFTSGEPYRVLNPDRDRANDASQTDEAGSLLSHYRRLIDLRQGHPALSQRDWADVGLEGSAASLYAFLRRTPGETLLVLANLGTVGVTDYGLDLPPGLRRGVRARELLTEAAVPPPAASAASRPYRPLEGVEPLRPTSSASRPLGLSLNPLATWKTDFETAETVGKEKVAGKPCSKVVLTSAGGPNGDADRCHVLHPHVQQRPLRPEGAPGGRPRAAVRPGGSGRRVGRREPDEARVLGVGSTSSADLGARAVATLTSSRLTRTLDRPRLVLTWGPGRLELCDEPSRSDSSSCWVALPPTPTRAIRPTSPAAGWVRRPLGARTPAWCSTWTVASQA
jgi:hypothetical protein